MPGGRPELKPPSFPKPIRTEESLERERVLKNRLKLKFGQTYIPYRNTAALQIPVPSSQTEEPLVRGVGEQQFADNSVHEQSSLIMPNFTSSLFEHSSVMTEMSGMRSRIVNAQRISAHDRFLSAASRSLVEATSRRETLRVPEVSLYKTHLDVSQSFVDQGMPTMVQSLLQGTDFCYVDHAEEDFYHFGVKNTIPPTLLANEYSTVSARGLLRAVGDDSELVPFPELAREATIYAKLQQLPLFRTYRIWKTFYVWKHTVHHRRHASRVSFDI